MALHQSIAHSAAAREAPVSTRPSARAGLQDRFGNRGLLALLHAGAVQRKARVSEPGDPDEREADRAADAVMRGERTAVSSPARSDVQRACCAGCAGGGGCEEEQKVHRKADRDGAVDAPSLPGGGGGRPLADANRSFMESRFGADFSRVRVHTDGNAAAVAGSINALAFTHGRDIYVGAGQLDERGDPNRRLLAHELAHVVQQRQT